MRLRHLLWRSVPCQCEPCHVTITAPAKTKHVHAMLEIAAKFPGMTPDGSPASDLHAQSWLLQECSADLLKQLSQLLSIEPPANDADGVSKCAPLTRKRFSFFVMLSCRLFGVLKVELLSMCSGTGSFPTTAAAGRYCSTCCRCCLI